ncbi:MAG: hypothetical protein K2K57_07395 [Oscillospiraceae bacterium]|nr:hypothetical protein [Oscillospiraceae bacterium]
MRNFALVCVMFLAAALMLTGCVGDGENVTESRANTANLALETALEDITTEKSVSKEEITESTAKTDTKYMERVMAFKASNAYRERDMYGVKIIRSPEELESFTEIYEIPDWKEQLTEFGEEIDFDKNVIAADIVFLSSGGYDFDFYYTTVENGEVNFEYELIENKYGMTDDEAALFMFARIPAELVEISDSMIVEKALQIPEQTMSFKTSGSYEQDMYGLKIIRSFGELESFTENYGISEEKEQLKEFGEGVDFGKNAIAANIVCLSSADSEYYNMTEVGKGGIVFNYSLKRIGYSMADGKAVLFMFAAIPKEFVNNFDTANTGKKPQYPAQIMGIETNSNPDDDLYGTVKIIRSLDEFTDFAELCSSGDVIFIEDEENNVIVKNDVADAILEYGENIDFEKNVVAVKAVFLSSGSYDFKFHGTSVSEGEIRFVYDLVGYDVMTCDTKTLFMFAAIPAEFVD